MIGDSTGLFPHFLGILSQSPSAHGDAGHPGIGEGEELHHPFSSSVPALRKKGTSAGAGPKPAPKGSGSKIFVEGAVDHSEGGGQAPAPAPPRSHVQLPPYQPRYTGDKSHENNYI